MEENQTAALGNSLPRLHRALALAPNIANTFGKPIAIFAPNPSHPEMDAGTPYDYVRPLATIAPMAVLFGLPVDVSLDLYDKRGLVAALEKRRARDHDVFILVAWEHKEIAPTMRAILSSHGANATTIEQVYDWDRNDFDSMYIVAITQLKDGTELRSNTSTKTSTGSQTSVRIDRTRG